MTKTNALRSLKIIGNGAIQYAIWHSY